MASCSSAQSYELVEKTRLSPDSYLLKYSLQGSILGLDPALPTCIKVDHGALSKSYSPVSHPNSKGSFDLIVKSYPLAEGGGVGQYLCGMAVGGSVQATLKKPRIVHGSAQITGRWKRVGLIAGGTGIAPLLQLARILLEDDTCTIHLLFVNRGEQDILGRAEIDRLAALYKDRFFVAYALTTEEEHSHWSGRGTVDMAHKTLPPPSSDTMIFICGKDGFVAHWAGPVARAPPKPDGSKGPKIQGPLLGVLNDAGYTPGHVFKY